MRYGRVLRRVVPVFYVRHAHREVLAYSGPLKSPNDRPKMQWKVNVRQYSFVRTLIRMLLLCWWLSASALISSLSIPLVICPGHDQNSADDLVCLSVKEEQWESVCRGLSHLSDAHSVHCRATLSHANYALIKHVFLEWLHSLNYHSWASFTMTVQSHRKTT